MRYKAMAKKLRQVVGLADPIPAEAVLAEPRTAVSVQSEQQYDGGRDKRDYGSYKIVCRGRKGASKGQCIPDVPNGTQGEVHANAPKGAHAKVHKPAVARIGVSSPAAARAEVRKSAAARAEVPDLAVVRARAVWLEVVEGVRGSPTALMERLDALTDPERVDEVSILAGWKAKYENEITVRMKSSWWRRMAPKRDVG